MGTVRSIDKTADAANGLAAHPGSITAQIVAGVFVLLLILGVCGSLAAYW